MRVFSGGRLMDSASHLKFIWCRTSPCHGRKKRGVVRLRMSFSSSWEAWPEAWTL